MKAFRGRVLDGAALRLDRALNLVAPLETAPPDRPLIRVASRMVGLFSRCSMPLALQIMSKRIGRVQGVLRFRGRAATWMPLSRYAATWRPLSRCGAIWRAVVGENRMNLIRHGFNHVLQDPLCLSS
ncbi:MAG: hypothetical protein Q7J57_15610 [Gemmobacter sp.]|nr:hypothetical protein [Gemmobacter sp.]